MLLLFLNFCFLVLCAVKYRLSNHHFASVFIFNITFNFKNALQYQAEINRNCNIPIFNILRSEQCHARVPGGKRDVLDFLRWMHESKNDDAKIPGDDVV